MSQRFLSSEKNGQSLLKSATENCHVQDLYSVKSDSEKLYLCDTILGYFLTWNCNGGDAFSGGSRDERFCVSIHKISGVSLDCCLCTAAKYHTVCVWVIFTIFNFIPTAGVKAGGLLLPVKDCGAAWKIPVMNLADSDSTGFSTTCFQCSRISLRTLSGSLSWKDWVKPVFFHSWYRKTLMHSLIVRYRGDSVLTVVPLLLYLP